MVKQMAENLSGCRPSVTENSELPQNLWPCIATLSTELQRKCGSQVAVYDVASWRRTFGISILEDADICVVTGSGGTTRKSLFYSAIQTLKSVFSVTNKPWPRAKGSVITVHDATTEQDNRILVIDTLYKLSSAEKFSLECLSLLDGLLLGPKDLSMRQELLLRIQQKLMVQWPQCTLHVYGSTMSGFGFHCSDMDICFIQEGVATKEALDAIEGLLVDEFEVEKIDHARVPIIKLRDTDTDLCCDICINNTHALKNTSLLRRYCQSHPLVRVLACLVKHWSKERGINDPANGTLSSYAFVMMVIHFLQSRGIVSCLETASLNSSADFESWDEHVSSVEKNCGAAKLHCPASLSFSQIYTAEQLYTTVQSFFQYFARDFDHARSVVSIRTGRCLPKIDKWKKPTYWRTSIEDPIDVSHDVGRPIFSKQGQYLIFSEFQRAWSVAHSGVELLCLPRAGVHICYICGSEDHAPRNCDHMAQRSRFLREQRLMLRKLSGWNSGGETDENFSPDEELTGGSGRKRGPECWNCGKMGHMQSSCPEPSLRELLLFNGSRGSWSSDSGSSVSSATETLSDMDSDFERSRDADLLSLSPKNKRSLTSPSPIDISSIGKWNKSANSHNSQADSQSCSLSASAPARHFMLNASAKSWSPTSAIAAASV